MFQFLYYLMKISVAMPGRTQLLEELEHYLGQQEKRFAGIVNEK
jgi:hypothetical protein